MAEFISRRDLMKRGGILAVGLVTPRWLSTIAHADIIKMAMLHVAADQRLRDMGARLLLQVHDELVLEAPEDNARAAGERLKELMVSVVELSVPLVADMGVAKDWGAAH